ncbi:hypothetical protein [Plantactinospora sonchi]|uniref:Tachylectin 2 domain-containing protein n=1 Tax=Plantactinospora sonchi TaxID=1544735 RepID=A0ABU7S021_9ACTN
MLQARKPSIWRNRYEVSADGVAVATWEPSMWRSGGNFTLGGESYQVRSNTWGSRYTLLDANDTTVATADRVGRKQWTVEADGRTYHFRRTSFWGNEQELQADGQRVGSVKRSNSWRGDVTADLPGLPLPVQLFVLGVVITMWDSTAAATTTTAVS